MNERLTNRTDEEIDGLLEKHWSDLTFNDLLALAGRIVTAQESDAKNGLAVDYEAGIDRVRDLALVRTHLEDALTRYNSAAYRAQGTWKRADPDA